jgi:threonine dehydrogenase-like Zn-dependent dehydrogenase
MARFDRAKPSLKQQPKVLVICEDAKSGKSYLEDAYRHFQAKVFVEFAHNSKNDPRNIVNQAIKRQGKYDCVFCAIDRDTHETFDEAIKLIKTHKKVKIIASYPCFEFWLLLHFGYRHRVPYMASGKDSAADLVIKELRTYACFKNYSKGNVQDLFKLMLTNGFTEARRIAPKVLNEAIASGEMNPSTQLHELLDFFETLSTPQKITPIQ